MYPLQVSSLLEVVPSWLPPGAITLGFVCVSIGMGRQYFEGTFGHWDAYSRAYAWTCTICLTGSIAGATYATIRRGDLTLLFVFFIFMSGRVIQGAIAARFIQKILDFGFASTGPTSDPTTRAYDIIKSKVKARITLFVTAGIITLHTVLSISAVFTVGTGELIEAIERFWIGFFFLTILGLAFDFRHFAHRISWTAAIGLVIATAGSFLYDPVGFSTYTVALAPYLDNPVPDWMRWPLGAVGFVFGVILWAVFYVEEKRSR